MTSKTSDVVVIGGGITGCSAAYFLSKQGQKVTLIEKDSVAAHASGFAFGVLLPRIFESVNDPVDELTAFSLDLHRRIADELGSPEKPLRREKASVLLALEDLDAQQYGAIYRSGSTIGDVRWLEHGELSHIEARISPDVRGGLYLGDAAEISPHEFTSALWSSATKYGAELISGEVKSIQTNSDSVTVDIGDDTISSARLIVAAGPWSSGLLSEVGVTVPVEPLKGQIVRVKAPGPEMRVSLWWGSDYAGSKPDGLVWCGTTEERVGYDEEPDQAGRGQVLSSARKALPFLADAEVVQHTACLRPVSNDGMPVLGLTDSSSPVVVATGGGRNGIVLGPALGKVAADMATGTETDPDITALSPTRFSASQI